MSIIKQNFCLLCGVMHYLGVLEQSRNGGVIVTRWYCVATKSEFISVEEAAEA